MMEQSEVSVRTEQRLLLSTKLKRGQLFENSLRVKEALEIWDAAARETSEIVQECREQLAQEIAKTPTAATSPADAEGSGDNSDPSDNQEE